MQRDEAYALDIIQAAQKIEAAVGSLSKESFMRDELVQSAVLYWLTVIGEA